MTSQIPNTQTYDTNTKSPNSIDNALNSDTWQRVLLARNPKRPLFMDYANQLFSEFDILHGDRVYGDDKAVIGGLARLAGKPVMLIGQHRGRSTRERIAHNFGMANPEGYRKAVRLAKMAERFGWRLAWVIKSTCYKIASTRSSHQKGVRPFYGKQLKKPQMPVTHSN